MLRVFNDRYIVSLIKVEVKILVLFDLSSAFDTIDHAVLFDLWHDTFGISGTALSFSRPIAHTEPPFKTFNLLKFNDIYTLKLMKFFYKLSNDSLPAYFASYKTLIQHLTTRYPLRRPIYETFKVRHEYARISIKYQLLDFLNKLSESNSEFLDTILEFVYLQPFIGYNRLITNYLVSLYRYECRIMNFYVCNIAIV